MAVPVLRTAVPAEMQEKRLVSDSPAPRQVYRLRVEKSWVDPEQELGLPWITSLLEVRKRMEDIAVETAGSTPAELAAMTRADADKWGKIIRQLDLAPQ
jgi:hypothetical protein